MRCCLRVSKVGTLVGSALDAFPECARRKHESQCPRSRSRSRGPAASTCEAQSKSSIRFCKQSIPFETPVKSVFSSSPLLNRSRPAPAPAIIYIIQSRSCNHTADYPLSTMGSRNPFLQLLTPQSTGAPSSTSNAALPSTSSSAANYAVPDAPAKDEPQMPRVQRQATGVLNSPAPTPRSDDVDALSATLSASRPFSPPAGSPPRAIVTSPDNHTGPARNSTLDILQEELPPAYTPGPNALQGEQSVDFGPIRPFQNEHVRLAPRPIPDPSTYFSQPGHSRSNSNGSRNSSSLSQTLGSLLVAYLSQPPRESGRLSRFNSSSLGRSFLSDPPAPNMPSQSSRAWSQYPGQRSVTPEPQLRPPSDGKPTTSPIQGE